MNPTSLKFETFISEDMAEKPVTKLPGIGAVSGANLVEANIRLARDVYRKCRQLNFDQAKFQKWLEDISEVNHKQSAECYDALLEWDGQFNQAKPKTVSKYSTNNNASTSKYCPEKVEIPYERSKVNKLSKKYHYIHILHQNLAGLVNKSVRFMHALQIYENNKQIDVDVICITEHNMKLGSEEDFDEPGYKLAASFCRPDISRGGACIIVRNDVRYRSIPAIKDMSIPNIFECCAIELIPYNIIVVCIYRVPNKKELQTMKQFFESLENLLRTLRRKQNKHLVVAGDYNIDIMNPNHTTEKLDILLFRHNLSFAIKQITRASSGTCLDNIAHDFIKDWKSAVAEFNVSDHAAVLLKCPVDETSVQTLLQEKETEQEDLSKLFSRFDKLYYM